MTRVRLSDFSDIAAITWWTSLQDHLRDFQRVRDEMLEAQRLGLVIDDLELIAGAYNDAFMAMSSRYEAFKEAVRRLAPDAFTQLPLARCGDCLSIDPRQAALACELIFREGRADSGDIPGQFRSRPMTKTEAAEYLNLSAHYNDSRGENRKRALRRELNRLIESGEIRSQTFHNKKFIFDIRGFPKDKQDEMKL